MSDIRNTVNRKAGKAKISSLTPSKRADGGAQSSAADGHASERRTFQGYAPLHTRVTNTVAQLTEKNVRNLVKTYAKSAASLLVLAGILAGQAQAASVGFNEEGPDWGPNVTVSAPVKSSTGNFGGASTEGTQGDSWMSWAQKSLTPKLGGAKVVGQGFLDMADAMGHMFKAGHAGIKSTSKFLDALGFGAGAHQHLIGRGACLLDSGCETLNATTHLAKAGGKFLQGSYRALGAGPAQLMYENPVGSTLVTAGLIAYDFHHNGGAGLTKQLLENSTAVAKGAQTFMSTVQDKEFWQQAVSHSGLGRALPSLQDALGGAGPANGGIFDDVANSLLNLPERLVVGTANTWFSALDTLGKASFDGARAAGQALHDSGVGPVAYNLASKALTGGAAVAGKLAVESGKLVANLTGKVLSTTANNAVPLMNLTKNAFLGFLKGTTFLGDAL